MAAEVSERAYRKWLERKDLTIEELVETADAMPPEIAPAQTRYKVRERPDVRTIRYYITENQVHVHDLQATILHLLGLDHKRLTFRFQGRDYRLTDVGGNVVSKLIV